LKKKEENRKSGTLCSIHAPFEKGEGEKGEQLGSGLFGGPRAEK